MVREEIIGGSYSPSMGAGESQLSGPGTLETLVLTRASTTKSITTLTLEELRGIVPAQAPGEIPQVPPWKAAAQAKGRSGYFLAKRCLDFSLALISIVVLSPVFLVIALLVRFTSRGPALFRQERVGYAGRPFVMYKFRSMYVESDETLHQLAYEQFLRGERASGKVDGVLLPGERPLSSVQPDGRGVAKAKRQPSGDPRVTRVGNVSAAHEPGRAAPTLQRAARGDEPGRAAPTHSL